MQNDGSATSKTFETFIDIPDFYSARYGQLDTLNFRLNVRAPQAFDDGVRTWHEQQRQDRPASIRRKLSFQSIAGWPRLPARYHQRHDTEYECECRHQDRPKPETGSFHRGSTMSTLVAPTLGELNDQNRVFGGKAISMTKPI